MLEHVQHVLQAITEKIERLLKLKAYLEEDFSASPVAAAPASAEPVPVKVKDSSHRVSRKNGLQPLPRKPGRGSKLSIMAERLGVLRQLAEPITPELFAVAAGIDIRLAGVSLCGFAQRGLLARFGRGQYRRTGKFPGGSATGSREGTPGEGTRAEVRPPSTAPKVAVQTAAAELPEGSLERRVFVCAQAGPQEFSATSLALTLGLSADAIGIALVKLKRKGYVVDCTDPDDGETFFKLTAKKP